MELQTTRELLASSLKKVQDLELESGKVPALQSRIHELERNLGKSNNNTRYVHMKSFSFLKMNNFSFDTKSKRILTCELIFEKSLHF